MGSRSVCALCALALTLGLTSGAAAQSRVPAAAGEPLSNEAYAIAHAVPDEHTPEPPTHYPVSNEWRHDLWFDHVRDRGGAFVGVGSDQAYTVAAVQDASMIWIVDFDPMVPLVHELYGPLVLASEDPDALVARFAEESEAETHGLLERHLAGHPRRDAILEVYDTQRGRMHRYLRAVRSNRRGGSAGSWLAEPELYARVRALVQGNRIVARNGDVTADGALRAVGRAAAALEVPVNVLYFSNAEQFFPYGSGYRENFAALTMADDSLVLRTFREEGAPYPVGDTWHYMVQPASDLRARIDAGYRHSRQLVLDLMSRRDQLMGEDGISTLDSTVRMRNAPRAD